MTDNFALTQSYVTALTGDPNAILDWRVIHDRDKGVPAHALRGALHEVYQALLQYNNAGYGVFCNINAMDGKGRDLANVDHIRTHVLDLDDLATAEMNYQKAVQAHPAPHFAVQSSAGKFHLYWLVEPYKGNEFYTIQQRKLRQLYNGDKSVIDASRVLRVPGFYHLKKEPYLVTCWGVSSEPRHTSAVIEAALAAVNVFDTLHSRFPLGEKEMSAPSLDWLKFALTLVNPNDMDRGEWLSFSAAFKQAGWLHADEQTLLNIWHEWCNQYGGNDIAENMKLWNSVKDTEVGWSSIERRTPINAYIQFGFKDPSQIKKEVTPQPAIAAPINAANTQIQLPIDYTSFPEILDQEDCTRWFKDCYFIERTGQIFSPSGRFMNATQFNGKYGGKHFIITSTGKTTDEAWKAALRSTNWTIPKVDHVRFLPAEKSFSFITDRMGRKGLNTYIPAKVDSRPGDVTIWLEWLNKILPNQNDQHILISYLAHCIRYPGHKISWSFMLQSVEGIGKTAFRELLQHALGDMYVYQPKAPELISSGSKFNAWMRGKLMIVVDEIKIDERRELIEILKPMITDAQVEIQSKGVDQDMEDNPANWLFFSNYKDAVPINQNGRRYAISYSALQSKQDVLNAGMDEEYFKRFWTWLRDEGGYAFITHWLHQYPISCGSLPVRAPETSSYREALKISRSPMEVIIDDCIQDGLPGFKNGFVSTLAVVNRAKAAGIRNASVRAAQACLEGMGYVNIGKAPRPFAQEDAANRAVIYSLSSTMTADQYGRTQGYE